MISIFSYLNYRHFLRDYYLDKKRQNKSYSYRVFNRAAHLTSPSFFKLVCEEKRNLSEKTINSFIKALTLKEKEAQFFRVLVCFNQATTFEDKNFYYKQLCYFKEYNDVKQLEPKQYLFYSKWYHAAILEMARLNSFREDPRLIAKKLYPPITPKEATESLTLLCDLGLLKKDKNKCLKPVHKNFSTNHEVYELNVTNFHHNMANLAINSLLHMDGDHRDISSVTVALDKNGFEEAKRRIQEFRRELNVLLSQTKNPDHVFQINFQIFGLTNILWNKK